MIRAIKQKAIVTWQGKIEIDSGGIEEGTEVEVIVLIPVEEMDETKYLLSTQTNSQELLDAIARVENRENLVTITPNEWHEKYSF
ncbi:hypothetical protein H6G11_09955 [Cyanobacterium aponinum FACHB-4101]|uniref:hypothetical protein n=1 Tax=Cyanobacterium aponinum TaxID=379064 RepID=UPI0016805BF8|nr:hypothetical protein [Cyanobacterium aponinum]MBD2394574.1 hypothetical protein [Cyanobacterium aponinum FACHB-4101]